MKRKTLRIVPVDTDSSYSSDSTDSLYHTSPATPQFHRVMRAHINNIRDERYVLGSPCSYGSNGNNSSDSVRSTDTTASEYDRKIECQNKCVKRCSVTCFLALLCGGAALA